MLFLDTMKQHLDSTMDEARSRYMKVRDQGRFFFLLARKEFCWPALIGCTGSGDYVAMEGTPGQIFVPQGYVSGHSLSDSMTFNNATFASLRVTPGTCEWTWGSGLPNQNFTPQMGPARVPDGGSTVSLLSFALLGLASLRRKLIS